MATEREAIIRGAIDAWNRADLAALVERCHPELVLIPLRARLDGSPYLGHDGLRRFFADMDEEWEYMRVEVEELRDASSGAVLVLGKFRNKGRASGVEMHLPAGWLVTVEDGLITRFETFTAPEEALAAAEGAP